MFTIRCNIQGAQFYVLLRNTRTCTMYARTYSRSKTNAWINIIFYTYTKISYPNEYKQIPCFTKEEHFIPQTKTWSNRIVKPCLNSFHVLSYLSEMKLPKYRGNVTKTKGPNNSFMKSFYSYGENITAFHFSPVKNLHTGI